MLLRYRLTVKKNLRFYHASVIFAILLLFSCRTTSFQHGADTDLNTAAEHQVPGPGHDGIAWTELAEGIRTFSWKNTGRKIEYHIVEIDLSNPALKITARNTGSAWLETEKVENFARRTGSQVAVNTTPFNVKCSKNPFSKAWPVGIQVSDGRTEVPPKDGYSAICFFDEPDGGYSAKILENQGNFYKLGKTPLVAQGGFWVILKDGEIRKFKNIKDVRSAAALKDGGRTLLVFAGKNFSYMDCAEILQNLGAEEAMQFDGGNSTNLVINGRPVLKYGIRRRVPSMIGFKIKNNSL